MESDLALSIRELSHSFGRLQVLERLNLSVAAGEFLAILGPSGCGKTVLLRILAGLQPPGSGAFTLRDGPVAYAFQKSPLFPWLSVEENIRICLSGVAGAEAKMLSYLEQAGLSGFRGELPSRISVGMRQKVNVIRAFCSGRQLVLMDEPFVSLDFPGRRELQQLTLDLWRRERKTILFVTHDLDEALLLSQRVLVLSSRPGRVLKDLPFDAPYPRDPVALRAGGAYQAAYRELADSLLSARRKSG